MLESAELVASILASTAKRVASVAAPNGNGNDIADINWGWVGSVFCANSANIPLRTVTTVEKLSALTPLSASLRADNAISNLSVLAFTNNWVTSAFLEESATSRLLRSAANEASVDSLANPTLSLLIHCYAMTIHKSQGSEYQYVIGYLPSDNKSSGFINFNLMYTWITRAKRAFWMVGNRQYLEINATMTPPFRHDNLCQRLKKLMNIQ